MQDYCRVIIKEETRPVTRAGNYIMAENRLFYCYSTRLKNALIENGFVPIKYGVNPNTKSPYWVFEGTEEMNEYKNNKYQFERDRF